MQAEEKDFRIMKQQTAEYYAAEKRVWRNYNLSRLAPEEFQAKALKKAEAHFSQSIEKLAARVAKKGLNVDACTVAAQYLDANLACTITDGEKTVSAYTIIAEGPIQRPHYRYLIK